MDDTTDGLPGHQSITCRIGYRECLPDGMQAGVTGTYSTMRATALYGRNLPVMADLMADNVYISSQNSGRYLIQNNYSYTNASAEPNDIWNGLYAVIKNANVVINSDIASTPVVDQLRGEALTIRAWMHFDLVRWYAIPYSVNTAAPGVPIVTKFEQTAKPARNTVAEVYTQIVNDLTQASTLMTNTTKNSANITKYVAKGLLAKVYLYMGDWAKARDAALDVVNNGGFTLVDATGYVNYWKNAVPITTKVETMFELSLDATANNGTNALAYIYDQAGYGDLLVTNSLYNLYSTTDVRRNVIISGTRASLPALIVNKYSNTNTAADKDEIKMLRYAEVLLVLAEAYYRLNDETNAKLYLNMVAKKRDPSFAGYTSTGTQLLEDIITERRKELAFEGERFHDLIRLNRVINRGTQYPTAVQTIETNNIRRQQPIPQPERDANPNIEQNPGY